MIGFVQCQRGKYVGKIRGLYLEYIALYIASYIIFKILFLYINDVNVQYKYLFKHLMIFQIFLFLKYVHEPHVDFMRKLPKKRL